MKLLLIPKLKRCRRAFTFSEVLVIAVVVAVFAGLLGLKLFRGRTDSAILRCMNNHRQLIQAWHMYGHDFNEILPAAQGGITARPNWMAGNIQLGQATTTSQYDTNVNITVSPLWPYMSERADILRCPSDRSTVLVAGTRRPRVRSISMSQVFGNGEWLNGTLGFSGPYRLYSSAWDIRRPASTFVFTDEHPDGINDGAFANQVSGAEPSSPPGGERIIDFPGSFHDGGCTFSFASGHVEVRYWRGATIQPPAVYTGTMPLNVLAGDSGVDVRWLASVTTVRQ